MGVDDAVDGAQVELLKGGGRHGPRILVQRRRDELLEHEQRGEGVGHFEAVDGLEAFGILDVDVADGGPIAIPEGRREVPQANDIVLKKMGSLSEWQKIMDNK